MALSLVSPLSSNFIKDWPAQNAINCDNIDDFAGDSCLRTQTIKSYTPILGATTTAPTLGTGGTIQGYYYRIWDAIYTWGHFKFGSGFTAGTGTYTITTPFRGSTALGFSTSLGLSIVCGDAYLWDESAAAARQPLSIQFRGNDLFMFGTKMASTGVVVTHNTPITWAQDDGIKWFARYKRLP